MYGENEYLKNKIKQVVTVLQNSNKVRTVRCKMVPRKKEATRICKKVPVKVCKEVPCKRTCSNSGAESLEECRYKSRKVCQKIERADCRASMDVPWQVLSVWFSIVPPVKTLVGNEKNMNQSKGCIHHLFIFRLSLFAEYLPVINLYLVYIFLHEAH